MLLDSIKLPSGREDGDSVVTLLEFSIVDVHCHTS